jgi:hypothetical protein
MNLLRVFTALGVMIAVGWFAIDPNFIAVFFGIVSLTVLMMAFLPIESDEKI